MKENKVVTADKLVEIFSSLADDLDNVAWHSNDHAISMALPELATKIRTIDWDYFFPEERT